MNIEKDITFRELRCYLSQIDRLSICMLETLKYENFLCLDDVPDTYNQYYVYGIGMIESEFYKTDSKYEYAVSGKREDLVLANCIEVMLSKEPKSVLLMRDTDVLELDGLDKG